MNKVSLFISNYVYNNCKSKPLLYIFHLFVIPFVLLRRIIYEAKKQKRQKVKSKPRSLIISVGSIAMGGAGKTSLGLYLTNLAKNKRRTVVVSRGYGRLSTKEVFVLMFPDISKIFCVGDEPFIYSARYNVPVIVGKKREDCINFALSLGAEIIILDDAFSYTKIYPDYRFLILTADCIGNGLLQPFGPLREPKLSLRYADVIFTEAGADFGVNHKRCFSFKTKISGLTTENISGNALALCGITFPNRFLDKINDLNISVVKSIIFPNHYIFKYEDILKIREEMKRSGADFVLTTEKDFYKIKYFKPDFNLVAAKYDIEIDEKANNYLLSII